MSRPRGWLWPLARLGLGLGMVAWIFQRLWSQPHAFDPSTWSPHWPIWMLAGHLCFLAAYLLGITRWRLLMRSHAISLSWGRCFTLFFIGHFFNAFMPGSTGGDMVKAWYVSRQTHHRKTEAATLVFLDRAMGLLGLIVLVLLVLAFRVPFLHAHPALGRIALSMLGMLGLIIGAVLLAWSRNWLESRALLRLRRLGRPGAVLAHHLGRAYGAFYHFRTQPGVLGRAFVLSLGVHALSLVADTLFAMAIGSGLTLPQAFTLFPLLGAFGAVPLTPGGLGFREGAAVVLFGLVGIPPATAFLLSLLPFLSATGWSLFGGLVYLLAPVRQENPAPPDIRS